MTIEELEKRIVELEAEVARLKAFPQSQHVIHSHYHYGQPMIVQQPSQPWPAYPRITWGGIGKGGSACS